MTENNALLVKFGFGAWRPHVLTWRSPQPGLGALPRGGRAPPPQAPALVLTWLEGAPTNAGPDKDIHFNWKVLPNC